MGQWENGPYIFIPHSTLDRRPSYKLLQQGVHSHKVMSPPRGAAQARVSGAVSRNVGEEVFGETAEFRVARWPNWFPNGCGLSAFKKFWASVVSELLCQLMVVLRNVVLCLSVWRSSQVFG